jgi:hypothetical protein
VAKAELPAKSVARAPSVANPIGSRVVSQSNVKGAAVSVDTETPLTRKTTRLTPLASAAVAVTGTFPLTVAPSAGAVNDTDGGVASGGITVKAIVETALVNAPSETVK